MSSDKKQDLGRHKAMIKTIEEQLASVKAGKLWPDIKIDDVNGKVQLPEPYEPMEILEDRLYRLRKGVKVLEEKLNDES